MPTRIPRIDGFTPHMHIVMHTNRVKAIPESAKDVKHTAVVFDNNYVSSSARWLFDIPIGRY